MRSLALAILAPPADEHVRRQQAAVTLIGAHADVLALHVVARGEDPDFLLLHFLDNGGQGLGVDRVHDHSLDPLAHVGLQDLQFPLDFAVWILDDHLEAGKARDGDLRPVTQFLLENVLHGEGDEQDLHRPFGPFRPAAGE